MSAADALTGGIRSQPETAGEDAGGTWLWNTVLVADTIPRMTYHDLYRKLHDEPFKPFRVRLSNSTVIDVREPGSVIVGESSAVLPVEMVLDDRGVRVAHNWKTISIAHIVEFSDIESKAEDSKNRS